MTRRVSCHEPRPHYRSPMNNVDRALTASSPACEAADPRTLRPSLSHLLVTDTRTPEEQAAAQRREADRRAGRQRGKWWERYPELTNDGSDDGRGQVSASLNAPGAHYGRVSVGAYGHVRHPTPGSEPQESPPDPLDQLMKEPPTEGSSRSASTFSKPLPKR